MFKFINYSFLFIFTMVMTTCSDTTDPTGGIVVSTTVLVDDDTRTLADGASITYTLSRSGSFRIRVTVDNDDGLKLYYNGTYNRRVTSSYSETRSFSSGDSVKLENDTSFGLGPSITYTKRN